MVFVLARVKPRRQLVSATLLSAIRIAVRTTSTLDSQPMMNVAERIPGIDRRRASKYFRSILRAGASVAGVLTIALLSNQSIAQTDQSTPPSNRGPELAQPSPSATAGGLEEIVVTARKREESAQDTPLIVSVVSGTEIARKDLSSLEKLAAVTPDLSIGTDTTGGANQISLRGISSSITTPSIEQSTAIVVDGVYYGTGQVVNEGFFDLGQLEILKGPQALFFGKNATAGVISMTSNDPTNTPEYKATAAYEFRSQQLQVALIGSQPLTDTLGIRVAVRATDTYGGYSMNEAPPITYTTANVQDILAGGTGTPVTHVAQPVSSPGPTGEQYLGRVTLKWDPNDRLSASLKGSGTVSDTYDPEWNATPIQCPTGVGQLDGLPCSRTFVTHLDAIPPDIASTIPLARDDGQPYSRYRSYAITGTVNYKLEDFTITSVTNYNWNNTQQSEDSDFQAPVIGNAFNGVLENINSRSISSELRTLSHFDGPVNFMIGGLFQRSNFVFLEPLAFGGLSNSAAPLGDEYIAVTKDSFTEGETESGFAQIIWKIVPTVEATVGARYTHETKDSFYGDSYVNPEFQSSFREIGTPAGVITANQTFNNVSPEATLSWKPVTDIMVYGSYKTGYKSGGFDNDGLNTVTAKLADFTFAPETVHGFETGIKTTLFDQQLRANLSAYTYDYDQLQVEFFDSVNFNFQVLGAQARVRGTEGELEYAPRAIDGLRLHADFIYNQARYTSFPDAPCYGGETQSQGCNLVVDDSARQNLDGKPLVDAPNWAGTLSVNYERAIGDRLRFGASTDAHYSGSYLTSPFGNGDSRQGGYTTLDAEIHLATEDGRWEVALLGKNLTNKFYVTGIFDGPSTGTPAGGVNGIHSDQIGFFNPPVTIQLRLSAKY
jgi:iron complex outermembrane recepter protein